MLDQTGMCIGQGFAVMGREPIPRKVCILKLRRNLLLKIHSQEALEMPTTIAPKMDMFPLRLEIAGQVLLQISFSW
jgi:hypothetical protein